MVSVAAGIGVAILTYGRLENNQLFIAILYGTPLIVAGGLRTACYWQET